MRAFALVIALVWLAASITYAVRGYRTKKAAVAKLEDEREGRYVPEVVKAEPQLPKSLEERLLAIAAQEGTLPGGAATGSDDPGAPPLPAGGAAAGAPSAADAAPTSPPGAMEAPPPPPDAAPLGSIFDAPAPPPPPPPPSATGRGATTVAEALVGIELPCDLVPLVAAGTPEIDPLRVPFITRGFAPTAIAVSLRDALVGSGFEFRSTGPMSAIATRDAITLAVDVHDAPSTVIVGTERRYPSATLDSVVVEITST